ncbi:MAG: PHB depolymerase family esterase [Pseudomonadota bacterium]
MAKSLTSLWLKNLRTLGKAQRSSQKLFKNLLPKAAKKISVPKLPAAKPLKTSLRKRTVAVKTGSPPAGTWRKGWFTNPAAAVAAPGKRLLYWLYLPSGDAMALRPLVVMLHGCQQSAADFAQVTRMNELAERKGFAVLYPQQSGTADRHRCWRWFEQASLAGGGDVELVSNLVAHIGALHFLDPARTYAAGLSAGGGLACLLGLHRPEQFAAVALHSAPVAGVAETPLKALQTMQHGSGRHLAAARALLDPETFPGLPALIIQGDRDPVVRAVNGRQLASQFEQLNAPSLASAEPAVRNFLPRAKASPPRHGYRVSTWRAGRKLQIVLCEVQGLNHAWCGGASGHRFSAPEGPDASLMIWRFFSPLRRLKARQRS